MNRAWIWKSKRVDCGLWVLLFWVFVVVVCAVGCGSSFSMGRVMIVRSGWLTQIQEEWSVLLKSYDMAWGEMETVLHSSDSEERRNWGLWKQYRSVVKWNGGIGNVGWQMNSHSLPVFTISFAVDRYDVGWLLYVWESSGWRVGEKWRAEK